MAAACSRNAHIAFVPDDSAFQAVIVKLTAYSSSTKKGVIIFYHQCLRA